MADKILITGASGFVGSWLVKEALSRDLDVYAGIRATSSKELLDDPRTKFVILDFEDEAALVQVMAAYQFDYVIHNAGITRAAKDETYFRVNSEYAVRLAKAWLAGDGNLKKYTYISSVESHGSADDTPEGVVDATTPPNPRTMYGQSKLHGEKALKEVDGLPLMILRPTAVFGPGEKDLFVVFKTIKQYGFAPVMGSKEIRYSFVYVKDLVRVVVDSTISELSNKAYFITDGRIYPIARFTKGIADAMKKKTWGFTIPFGILEGVVLGTSVLDKITGKKSLLNREQLDKMKARNWDFDIGPLVTEMGYQPRYTLEKALTETVDWYQEKGWL